MKIVITGGAGFIGSHIAEHWSSAGAKVHVLDNLRSGFLNNIENIENVIIHKGSITNKELVFEVLKDSTYVFNLAALVSVPESLEKPEECVEINTLGLLNILEAAKKYKIKKVVQSSSAAVYGDDPELPKRINMRPNPKSPYGVTKLDGEYYCQIYYENFGIRTVSLRYFNVFGPRQNPESQYAAAVPIFIHRALKNEKIIIYGDGEQTRDFVFVKDVVKANVLAAEKEEITGVFNVAKGSSISINELCKIIVELTNSTSEITFEEERPGDIKHSLADVEETQKILGFDPEYELNKGLIKTIEHTKNQRQ